MAADENADRFKDESSVGGVGEILAPIRGR